jgi:uncharacterized protein
MSERQGIEIDYCPNCRGVWLDRGELDKIIDKSVGGVSQPMPQQVRNDPYQGQHQTQGVNHSQQTYYPQQGHHKKKKREGFLGELFDFD